MIFSNLADNFGALADTVEVTIAVIMIILGIILTYAVQKWADKIVSEQVPPVDNKGLSGAATQYEHNSLRG